MFKRSNAAKLTVCLALMWMIIMPITVMAFQSEQYVEVKKPITVLESQPQHYVEVKVNGSVITFPDAQPYIDSRSKHTMLPIRFVSKALDLGVEWVQKDKTVQITKGNFVGGIPRHLIKN